MLYVRRHKMSLATEQLGQARRVVRKSNIDTSTFIILSKCKHNVTQNLK